MITTLLVGFGFSAKTFHLPFLEYLSDFTVTAVVSSKPDDVNRALPNAMVYASLEEALESQKFDLVVITTPNHLHSSQAFLALTYGCHVLVEKPFTLSTKDAEQLVSLANKKNKRLCVFHNRRFDGDFLTLKQLMEEGRFGKIKRFESRFDRFRPVPRNRWRENAGPGSGIFWDLGPHLIDQALQLFGKPKAVSANVLILRDGGQSDDTFDITLHYSDKVVNLGSSAFQAGATLRFDLQGTKASYRKFYLDPQEDQLRQNMRLDSESWAVTSAAEHGILANEGQAEVIQTCRGQYILFFEQLADAINKQGPLPADAESVVEVIHIIETAIQASVEERKLPIN
ncbi:Gfo/Idh/MocA family oxidoreductase [Alteromonas hispanica]|uniref:Gfo/Idh/MocA family oxidoreductase n=1 Tax=Alteromonas hispanica TaxID=315421 RepID=A0A6L9MTD2_9ALTE|nr:Gfo/Idh/MocA family oxidoreductase [Alteromonas hispanica]NDW21213.1 Gfo/Idh/MocA family oxidoreductase [Alteromonas hispanica]